jgi:hypothetical protein
MREFHLSYDVTSSDTYNSTKVKECLVANLINLGIYQIDSPVASTLVFEVDKDIDEAYLKRLSKLLATFNDIIYYHLSLTAQTENHENVSFGNPKVDDGEFTRLFDRVLNSISEPNRFREYLDIKWPKN